MDFSSLFLRSELIFWQEHSHIEVFDDLAVITTPENPYWRWGNLIVVNHPPTADDSERLQVLYQEKIRPIQVHPHRLIVWDDSSLDEPIQQFYATQGLSISRADVLTLAQPFIREPHKRALTIEEVNAESPRWPELIEMSITSFASNANNPFFSEYIKRRYEHYRQLTRRNFGRWYVAIENGIVAGALGLFANGGISRFQQVAVHPDYQRRGIASNLVFEVSKRARNEFPNNTVVIVSDEDADSLRVYRSVGYTTIAKTNALKELVE